MEWRREVTPRQLTIDGTDFAVDGRGMDCPIPAPSLLVARALFELGVEPEDLTALPEPFARPTRLVRADTHGTVFTIAEPVPELIALLRQLKLESAIHKQYYSVERL